MSNTRNFSKLSAPVDRRTLLVGGATGLTLLGVGGLTVLGTRPAYAAPKVGQAAPDFSVVDSNGATQSLSALRGKPVVLEWTNHGCPFVRKHYDANNMQNLQRQAADAGVVWLSVISSPPGEQGHVSGGEANDLTKKRNAAPTSVLLDPEGKVARAYEARVTPHMYIIGADGTLLYMGGIDSIASTRADDLEKATPYFRDALVEVAKGQPVSNPVTRPYGCVVKYSS